jgi:Flp pilus assembly pilin Flp
VIPPIEVIRPGIDSKHGEEIMSLLKNFLIEEDGQDLVEYGLVLAAVVAAGVLAFTAYSSTISTGFSSIYTAIAGAL